MVQTVDVGGIIHDSDLILPITVFLLSLSAYNRG